MHDGAGSLFPGLGDLDLLHVGDTAVDGGMVHSDNFFALLAVRSGGSILHVLDSILDGDDVRQFEESGLQDGVDAGCPGRFPYRWKYRRWCRT